MARTVKSARGQSIDFDLLKIKESIAANPKPVSVKAREDFIDKKLRRRIKKLTKKVEKIEVDVEPKVIDN